MQWLLPFWIVEAVRRKCLYGATYIVEDKWLRSKGLVDLFDWLNMYVTDIC